MLEPEYGRGEPQALLSEPLGGEPAPVPLTLGPTLQVLYELPTSSQWCFDIQWCPRNPAVLSAAGFDGHIDVFSIMGGSSQAQTQRYADQVRLTQERPQRFDRLTGNV